MRSVKTYPDGLWKIVEQVGLRGEVVEKQMPTEANARSVRAMYHAFKASVKRDADRLRPRGLKAEQIGREMAPGEQRTAEVSEYIDNVVCYADGRIVRFVPRNETKMAKLFSEFKVVGKAPSAKAEEQSLHEAMKSLLEEQESGKLDKRR